MKQAMIVDAILLGPVGILIVYGALRIFFRNSILFKIGFVMGLFALIMANIVMWSNGIGKNSYFWTVPSAIISLYFSFRYLNRHVKYPLMEITNVLMNLKKGDIQSAKRLDFDKKDEFGDIAESANQLIDGFSNMSHFAREIGKGNLEVEYETLSDKDVLGNSILDMKSSLVVARDEDAKRKLEDQKVHWTNEGFAKFGEILRNNSEDNKEFYYTIISNLVRYVNANQGGLFLVNDDIEEDKYIELVAMYAYERRKYVNKRIEFGENLVGQCVLEGESIYMTEIPQNYIRVTSGLGDANPSCILLVPLVFNEQVFGVIELASFSEIEPYQKTFVEKLGESIASTISTYKINLRTVKLLNDSKLQSEELAAQEEEIRQNMEELQTTQEESARREAEMSNTLEAFRAGAMVAELDLQGRVINLNSGYQRVLGVSNAANTYWGNFLVEDDSEQLAEMMQEIVEGQAMNRVSQLTSGKKICESYSLVNDADGYPMKIVNVGLVISDN